MSRQGAGRRVWHRADLLHPATILASISLFVALGGVTYAAATIGTSDIKNGAVTSSKLATGAVANSKLAKQAVTNSKVGSAQISTSKIKNAAIIANKLASNAVTNPKLADGSVSTGKLADLAVTTGKLADGSVATGKLGDAAVTTGKLANLAVSNGKLADGSVTTGKLADAAVTTGKLADGSVTASKLGVALVAGRGSQASFRQVVGNGASTTVFSFPGLGTLTATCAAGSATTHFTNQAGQPLTIWFSGVDNGATDTAFVDRSEPANGLTITHTNAALGGVEQIDWQASFTDGGGTTHVAHASVTSGATLTNCTVTGTAFFTG